MARAVSKRGAHTHSDGGGGGSSRSVAIQVVPNDDSSSSTCPLNGTTCSMEDNPPSAPLSSSKLSCGDALLPAGDDEPRRPLTFSGRPPSSTTGVTTVRRNERRRKHHYPKGGGGRARRSGIDLFLTIMFNLLLFTAVSIIVLTTLALTRLTSSSSSRLIESDDGGSGKVEPGWLTREWGTFLRQSHLVTEGHHRTGVRGSLAAFAASGAGVPSSPAIPRPTFPSPAEAAGGPDTMPFLTPTFGKHRPSSDAVFAFAEGYDLGKFVVFVRSLREVSGFDGDVVLAVSSLDKLSDGVEDYLRSQPNVIVYALRWKCSKPGGGVGCTLDGIYGRRGGAGDDGGTDVVAVDDPRPPRPLATARFELYWVWSTRYDARSRMLLVDFRDTYFQRNPFDGIIAAKSTSTSTSDGGGGDGDGVLYFFEEDEKTRIKDSTFNQDWLRSAYGESTLQSMWNEKIICSGATMGEQVAVETYLRAMVHEFDSTKCVRSGCDQGMHNYLVRRGGFSSSAAADGGEDDDERPLPVGIGKIVIVGQGMGAVNNLGALRNRDSDLKGLGLYAKDDTHQVLNWDGSVSPVVHQWDRHTEVLAPVLQYRRNKWMREWRNNRK